jgi:hypothetical protein
LKSILKLKNPSAKVPAVWHFIFPITESFEKVLKISAISASHSSSSLFFNIASTHHTFFNRSIRLPSGFHLRFHRSIFGEWAIINSLGYCSGLFV